MVHVLLFHRLDSSGWMVEKLTSSLQAILLEFAAPQWRGRVAVQQTPEGKHSSGQMPSCSVWELPGLVGCQPSSFVYLDYHFGASPLIVEHRLIFDKEVCLRHVFRRW